MIFGSLHVLEGHTRETFPYDERIRYDNKAYQHELKQIEENLCIFLEEGNPYNFQKMKTTYFYDICERFEPHSTIDCPYNVNNINPKWCRICRTNQHTTTECIKNLKTRVGYHMVYHTHTVE